MTSEGLRDFLRRYKLTQHEFAVLIGASLRSVNGWLAGGTVPGPVSAYIRVFGLLPEVQRAMEIYIVRTNS